MAFYKISENVMKSILKELKETSPEASNKLSQIIKRRSEDGNVEVYNNLIE